MNENVNKAEDMNKVQAGNNGVVTAVPSGAAVNREQRRLPPLLRGHNEMCPDCPSQAITADGQLTQLEIGTSVVTYYGEIVELKETDTHE